MVTSQTHTLKVHEEKEFYLEDLLLLDAIDMMASAEPIDGRESGIDRSMGRLIQGGMVICKDDASGRHECCRPTYILTDYGHEVLAAFHKYTKARADVA